MISLPNTVSREGLGAALRPFASPALAVLALLVFGSAWAGIAFTGITGRVATIWIANAAMIVWALKGRRLDTAPVLLIGFLANLAADLASGDPLATAVSLSLCNIVEVVIVVAGLRRLGLDGRFASPRTLGAFYALAVVPAPAASALLAGLYLHLSAGAPFWASVNCWYLSDTLGLVTLVPPLMGAYLADFRSLFGRRQIRGTLLSLLPLAAVIFISLAIRDSPFAFLFFPAVLVMTLMRGIAGGVVGLVVCDLYLLVPVLSGRALMNEGGLPLQQQITVVLLFAAVISFTVALTGVTLETRRRLERDMAAALQHAKDAREEALVAKNAAEDASRTKSSFLANMSHELRTPLNAVIGFSEIMKNEMFGPMGVPRYREYAGTIHGAGSHLLELVNDVLDMAKIEAGKFEIRHERIDLAALVADCVALMGARAGAAGLELAVALPGKPIGLKADARALKQILLNLLSNAVKFTPAGGRVCVEASVRSDAAGNKVCALCVRDTGIGIPADELKRLGSPFVQLRQAPGVTRKARGWDWRWCAA